MFSIHYLNRLDDAKTILYNVMCVSQTIAVFLLEFSVLDRNIHLSCARSFFFPPIATLAEFTFSSTIHYSG